MAAARPASSGYRHHHRLDLSGVEPHGHTADNASGIGIATASSILAFLSAIVPVLSGEADWQQATTFHLNTPFDGWYGDLTSMMAGLYLIGFGAPAFEAATCHVGETINQNRNVPRAMLASAGMAGLYFAILPVVWLGTLGAGPLGGDLSQTLGPTYAPWFGSFGRALALWFIMFNMFHGTLQPLAGAARVLSQLSEDGLLPRFLAHRLASTDVPWAASVVTAAFAIWFLLLGDPIWLVAAANFTYLIGIALPNVAVWLLRKNEPNAERPWRAPRGTIVLGVLAAIVWGLSTLLGFQQFGLPTVVFGLAMAYSGAAFYAIRKVEDNWRAGRPLIGQTLHVKLTGAMLLVLLLDAAGYIVAVSRITDQNSAIVVMLEDIFVAVAILSISVGIVLPGMIAHSADQVSAAASRLVTGTMQDFSNAMLALGRGDLEAAHARIDVRHIDVKSRDELGLMANNFNLLQDEIKNAAIGLAGARTGLAAARNELTQTNDSLKQKVEAEQRLGQELRRAKDAAEAGTRAKSEFMATMSHELRTPLTSIMTSLDLVKSGLIEKVPDRFEKMLDISFRNCERLVRLIDDILDVEKIESGKSEYQMARLDLAALVAEAIEANKSYGQKHGVRFTLTSEQRPAHVTGDHNRLMQVLANLLSNAAKFSPDDAVVEVSLTQQNSTARVSVIDSGCGVPTDFHDKIFTRFAQADSSDVR
ncbi:MAG: amino acid permease [Rhodospirillaceae bacterium]|nr:amino acid permease [Rhodospirillaceae bacterium]